MGFWKVFWEFVGGVIDTGHKDIIRKGDEAYKGTAREAEWQEKRDNENRAYERLKKSAEKVFDSPKK